MNRFLIAVGLLLTVATGSGATMYQGEINSLPGGGMQAFSEWAGGTTAPNAVLSWAVDNTQSANGFWTYIYNWEATAKELSHIILQVSDTFTTVNLRAGTTPGYEGPTTYSAAGGNSNPGLPEELYGLKWGGDGTTFTLTIVTDREPMWGDFYAVDGKKAGSIPYAFNTGIMETTLAAIGDGHAGRYDEAGNYLAWVLVPDTRGIHAPEPSTVMLLGSGLLGLIYMGRKRRSR